MFHAWHFFANMLPEGRRTLQGLARYLGEHLALAAAAPR
jgi:hypothetical protein